ncbi:unnamed protein product [Angiostrongylus costaricensis]|uniref:SMC hinge domain-containing protein n=1 Tax=Angiostrongylus costaricensis TaxID=334426 RepID=A0A0R3PH11_ANGCS|nr:unnamed protein product [Angiostrongylus costaricensis]
MEVLGQVSFKVIPDCKMGTLHTLEIENFKSYRGKHIVGPFKNFTAIIGPNGSGKSNLMDAICFALGEKEAKLRVKKLGDLIHGAPLGKQVSESCSVTLNYKDADGRQRRFSRSATYAISEYRVDGQIVSVQQYNREIESVQIFIRAKNFLVYQVRDLYAPVFSSDHSFASYLISRSGQIEAIAMKSPKQRAALIEEISRSGELREEYDRLKAKLQEAEDDFLEKMKKRRTIAKEKKEAKLEACSFQAAKQRLLFLLELFHCEHRGEQAEEELVRRRNEVSGLETRKNDTEELVYEKQELVKRVQRDRFRLAKEIAEKEREISRQRPLYVQVKQEAVHVKTKLETGNKALNAAQKLAENTEQLVEMLEKAASDALTVCGTSIPIGLIYLQMNVPKINEYVSLKREAGKKSAMFDIQLDTLRREHETDRSCKVNEERRRMEWQEKVKNKNQEIERLKKQVMLFCLANELLLRKIEYLAEHAEQQTEVFLGEKANLLAIEKQVRESKEKLEKLSVELSEVNKQLSDASCDSVESERARQRNEAIQNLRRVFPDKVCSMYEKALFDQTKRPLQLAFGNSRTEVTTCKYLVENCRNLKREHNRNAGLNYAYVAIYGRLVDLCQPIHKRFTLAVTKVLQKHMMSIVCDSEDTARDAIMYLKVMFFKIIIIVAQEQRYPSETFLPYKGLVVSPVSEKLRELTYTKRVKLVYDVIRCSHPAARKALLFASGNAVICETAEDARTLAYGTTGGDRYNAVTLDGTMFQENGVIGGGGSELQIRAKKWEENALRFRSHGLIHVVLLFFCYIFFRKLHERRVQLLEESNTLHRTRKNEMDVEMQSFLNNHTLTRFQPKIKEIEERMVKRRREIEKLEEKSHAIADDVFASFCCKIGIKNIREYEEREMRFHQERIGRIREIENELDRIRGEVGYLRSEGRNKKVKQEADKLKKLETELDISMKKEMEEGKKLSRLEREMEELNVGAIQKKIEQKQYESEISAVKNKVQLAQRDVTSAEKAVLALESVVTRKQAEKHALLRAARINHIQIPLVSGSLSDIDPEEEDEDGDGTRSSSSTNPSQEQTKRESKIKVNYRHLPEDLKEVGFWFLSLHILFFFQRMNDEEDFKRHVERMNKEINEAQTALSRLSAPNLRATQRCSSVFRVISNVLVNTLTKCDLKSDNIVL